MSAHPLSEFTLHRRVHFYETDCAGIVHFSCFFKYLEEAEHAMWRAAGLSIAPVEGGVGFPRVSASFDYHRPLRFEDEFDVVVRIAAIGETSMRYDCVITKGDTRVATGSTTMVCVRKEAGGMKAVAFPEDIISRFQVARPPTSLA
jgi:4-hydroxybenzoyl-CoA thioesterase/acyl-CoA thioester hydrolase